MLQIVQNVKEWLLYEGVWLIHLLLLRTSNLSTSIYDLMPFQMFVTFITISFFSDCYSILNFIEILVLTSWISHP